MFDKQIELHYTILYNEWGSLIRFDKLFQYLQSNYNNRGKEKESNKLLIWPTNAIGSLHKHWFNMFFMKRGFIEHSAVALLSAIRRVFSDDVRSASLVIHWQRPAKERWLRSQTTTRKTLVGLLKTIPALCCIGERSWRCSDQYDGSLSQRFRVQPPASSLVLRSVPFHTHGLYQRRELLSTSLWHGELWQIVTSLCSFASND